MPTFRQGGSAPVPPLDALEELQRLATEQNPVQTVALLSQGVLRLLASVVGTDSTRRQSSPLREVGGGASPVNRNQSGGSLLVTTVSSAAGDGGMPAMAMLHTAMEAFRRKLSRYVEAMLSSSNERASSWNEARWVSCA